MNSPIIIEYDSEHDAYFAIRDGKDIKKYIDNDVESWRDYKDPVKLVRKLWDHASVPLETEFIFKDDPLRDLAEEASTQLTLELIDKIIEEGKRVNDAFSYANLQSPIPSVIMKSASKLRILWEAKNRATQKAIR
jgi:hypothetical protein